MANNITAYIGLGANLAQPQQQIKQALINLAANTKIDISAQSRLYRSKALLDSTQPDYYNAVVAIKTTLSPEDLLDVCQQIENKQQRIRKKKWAARTIDLDILLYGDITMAKTHLVIPHYQIAQRAFVLLPLADIDKHLFIPNLGDVSELITRVDCSGIIAVL